MTDADLPTDNSESGRERRRYFRIEEHVILVFREVEAKAVPADASFREVALDPFALGSQLELLSLESRALMRRIERDEPDIAEYLKLLERKIELIARSVVSAETDLADHSPREVNLSASGMAFLSENAYTPGQVLELKLALLPNLLGVAAYGRVIYCRKQVLGYRIGVDFIGLSERDRELLIRHITKRQSRQLRDKK